MAILQVHTIYILSCELRGLSTNFLPHTSDESEPSWLEPQLELKDFQLGSARDLFPFSSKSKIGRKRAEILILILIFFVYAAKSLFSTS